MKTRLHRPAFPCAHLALFATQTDLSAQSGTLVASLTFAVRPAIARRGPAPVMR